MQHVEGWVTIAQYCEQSGDTPEKVHKRVFDGVWIRGEHVAVPAERGPGYVNLKAVEAWKQSKILESQDS